MDFVVDNTLFEKTIKTKDLVGLRVLSPNGLIIGKVKEVRMNLSSFKVEGLVVKPIALKKVTYFSKTYIDKISLDSILLNIEPSLLYIGKRLIDSEGKFLGYIKKVNRVEETNKVKTLVAKRFLRKSIEVNFSSVKTANTSIILSRPYHERVKSRKNDNV